MTRPAEGVPQTGAEAQAFGWTWLLVKCQVCRNSRELRFADLTQARKMERLARFAQRLYCSKCRGRELEFSLGAYVTAAGQPWAERREISFDNGNAISPRRG